MAAAAKLAEDDPHMCTRVESAEQQRASLSEAGSKTGIPRKLPDEQKRQRINVARDLLSHFKPDGTERVTGVTTEA